VVCKAHPAHPGTAVIAADAIARAIRTVGAPAGTFALLQGWSHELGLALVRHPLVRAVGFTGSLRGGRALFDAAAARPEPIPVYAEMGSVNPVFLLPSALRDDVDSRARGLAQSVTLGVGQFCTNPGVVAGVRGDALERFAAALAAHVAAEPVGTMLYERLGGAFTAGVARACAAGATLVAGARETVDAPSSLVRPALLRTDAERFVGSPELRDELFGPVSLVVDARDEEELLRVADALDGQLTATIHGAADDLRRHHRLVQRLQQKVGRLVFNGFPTGVEVGHAMQHGGPYPASTDARTTSVGSAAILRFARPVCFQDFPGDVLPSELHDRNELGIWRLVDGSFTRDQL
jgi:NADP-dependent aldehyde dehydrogenase